MPFPETTTAVKPGSCPPIRGHRRRGRACLRAAGWSLPRPRPSTASAPTPTNGEAVARLYAAKGRPAFNPLIAHVADIARGARGSARSMPTPSGSPPRSGRAR